MTQENDDNHHHRDDGDPGSAAEGNDENGSQMTLGGFAVLTARLVTVVGLAFFAAGDTASP